MMKRNVKCAYCGKEEFNPKIPPMQVVDNCGDPACLKKSDGTVVGFKDGNIRNIKVENLYYVNVNLVKK